MYLHRNTENSRKKNDRHQLKMMIVIRPLINSFSIIGKPVSLQARNTKQRWQSHITETAKTYQKTPYAIDIRLDLQIDWFSQEHRNKPDIDNIVKPILDALRNVVYIDDSQVSSVSVKHHDLNSVLTFIDEPFHIVEPLISGEKEYIYIRAYRVY